MLKQKIKKNLYENLFNSGLIAFLSLVLFMFTIVFSSMVFVSPDAVRNPQDQIDMRNLVLTYLPYYKIYGFEIINYLKYSFILSIIYITNIISFIMIVKTLITGKCSFFKGKKLSNVVLFNFVIYLVAIPFVFEIGVITLLILSLFITGLTTIVHLWEVSSKRFDASCACVEN